MNCPICDKELEQTAGGFSNPRRSFKYGMYCVVHNDHSFVHYADNFLIYQFDLPNKPWIQFNIEDNETFITIVSESHKVNYPMTYKQIQSYLNNKAFW